jgi:hypothetical protein
VKRSWTNPLAVNVTGPIGKNARCSTRWLRPYFGSRSSAAPTRKTTDAVRRRVLLGHRLRDAEGPCVLDEIAHLLLVDRVEPHVRPVVAHVVFARKRKLLGLRVHERLPPLLRECEAHRRAVLGEGQPDDAADPELHPAADERLAASGQRRRKGANLVHRHHGAHVTVIPYAIKGSEWATAS